MRQLFFQKGTTFSESVEREIRVDRGRYVGSHSPLFETDLFFARGGSETKYFKLNELLEVREKCRGRYMMGF